jgi:hydroxymethylglutaryl-CoA reductase
VILFGEHSVVYGTHAVALPIGVACRARAERCSQRSGIVISGAVPDASLGRGLRHIVEMLGAKPHTLRIDLEPFLPGGQGLGLSAALALSVARAVADLHQITLTEADARALVAESERHSHGTPSGLDGAVVTAGYPILFRKDAVPQMVPIRSPSTAMFRILTGQPRGGGTRAQIEVVRKIYATRRSWCSRLFDRIDRIALAGRDALESGDLVTLGHLMNENHECLRALGVSTTEIERTIADARAAGALGAKLTGAGGGGCVVAVFPGMSPARTR